MSQRKGLTGAAITLVISLLAAAGLYSTLPRTRTASFGSWNPDKAYEISSTREPRWTHTKDVSDGWSIVKTMPKVLEAAEKQLARHKGDGYRIKRSDGTYGAKLNLNTVMKRLPVKLANLPYSDVKLIVRCLSDRHLMRFNKVDIDPTMMFDTAGVYPVDKIVGTIIQKYPLVRSAGICVCKKISGTNVWSQHAYCNAVDMMAPTQAYLDKVAAYARQLRDRGWLPAAQILWRIPNHYYHIHFSGAPMNPSTGRLAC